MIPFSFNPYISYFWTKQWRPNYQFYLQSNNDYVSLLSFFLFIEIVINDSEEDQQLRNLSEVDPR